MDDALIDLVVGFAAQKKNALVVYSEFLEYAEKYAYENNLTDLIRKLRDDKIEVIPALMQWEYKGACTIFRRESTVESVLVHAALKDLITAAYAAIEQNAEIPFPSDEHFNFAIPERLFTAVDVAKEFITFLTDIDAARAPLVKMTFPEGVKNLIVAKDIVKTHLIECCLLKLARYLQYKMNVSYMNNRLETLLSGNLESIKMMINDVLGKPKKVLQLVYDGDDFVFRFITQFTAIIIKDYRDKKTKHVDEQGFLQAAHLLGLFVGYQKSIVARQAQRELELGQLEKHLRRPPYAFSLLDLYNLKDGRGTRYSEKYDKSFIQDFIRRMTKPAEPLRLPALLSVKAGEDRDVYVHKDYVIPLFLNALKEAGSQLFREYVDEWQTLLKNNTRLPSMRYDHEFIAELNLKIKGRYPLLQALRNPQLLTLIKDEKDPNDAQGEAIDECFVKKQTLKSIDDLLDLKREKIVATVNTLLPSWYTAPLVKQIFFFFKWLLGRGNRRFKARALRLWKEGKGEVKVAAGKEFTELIAAQKEEIEQEEASQTRKEVAAKLKDQLADLRAAVIGKKTNLDERLEYLKEKWNPLYEETAKANLVEDVNSFIRDYLRRIKKSIRVRPPTPTQVKDMAFHLSEHKNLQAIKKKETLKTYIEAYIIQVLEEQYHIR